MIEIGLGLIFISAAAASVFGFTDGLLPFPIGPGLETGVAGLGAFFILHGLYRLKRNKSAGEDRRHVRAAGLASAIAALATALALSLPTLSEPLNLIGVAGFPLGFYGLAQGALAIFVVLLFVFAVRQDRIDDADEA